MDTERRDYTIEKGFQNMFIPITIIAQKVSTDKASPPVIATYNFMLLLTGKFLSTQENIFTMNVWDTCNSAKQMSRS